MQFLSTLLLVPTLAVLMPMGFCGNQACVAVAAEPSQAMGLSGLVERTSGGGRFMFVDQVPVLCVEGSPEEIGRQTAELVGDKINLLLCYPRLLMKLSGKSLTWERVAGDARKLWQNAPADHRKEVAAFVAASDIDRDSMLVGNLLSDLYRAIGCSSLLVEPSRSKTGGLLFGRNLDFYGGGILHKFTVVTVCRPLGKHAFASIGFSGLIGCLSGMNDAGLALAVHEVQEACDGSDIFNPQGVPYTFALRRILEECTTVDEAEKLLRSIKRTIRLGLAVCDRKKAIVLEITPKSVVRRDAKDGICVCTNHFCTPQLRRVVPSCSRFAALEEARKMQKLNVDEVIEKMDSASARKHDTSVKHRTLQTMIFEPETLRLHLSFEKVPSSAGPFHTVDLQPLLTAAGSVAKNGKKVKP